MRSTFDNFAPTFDERLRSLGYDAPQRLAAMLTARVSGPLDLLDLGCGTGLCGAALAPLKGRLTGVDLSEKMLVQARARGVYDTLHVGEINAWLATAATASLDAVVAADVFIYIGALDAIFADVGRVLRAGGWFAYTTEEQTVCDYLLQPTGRFAQSHAYIARIAAQTFDIVEANHATIRTQSGNPVPGRFYILRKMA